MEISDSCTTAIQLGATAAAEQEQEPSVKIYAQHNWEVIQDHQL